MTLRLPAGRTYALRAMAVNFAQRLWIDGVEQEAVGWPGEDAATTDPAARTVLCVFTLFVFYLGLYLFFRRKPYFLAFGVSCLVIAVHSLLVG